MMRLFKILLNRQGPPFSKFSRIAAVVLAGGLLAACSGGPGGSGLEPLGTPSAGGTPAAGNVIGNGEVKIALILPLSAAGSGGSVAASLRNAADLAVQEFNGPNIQLLVKDDRGTPDGAAAAARQALSEGADLAIGPLFAQSVRAASGVMQPAGKPIIAFSTDSTVAGRGTYLLSFLPETDVDRIVSYAASRGKKSFSALIPQTAYGNVVAAAFQQSVARHGGRIVALERYSSGASLTQAARNVAQGASQIDALFIPESGDGMPAVAQALAASRIDTKRVQLLGTGAWNDPRVFRLPQLAGGWFAAPDASGFDAFAQRYKAKYGSDPVRIATLSYDAVALAAALVRTRGSERFTEATLTNPSGFAGQDGVFRFRTDGLNDRGLAVLQVGNGTASVVSAAPKAFGPKS
jgi:ABC-type branched-subunit amino acid transport system substrate-binding protein